MLSYVFPYDIIKIKICPEIFCLKRLGDELLRTEVLHYLIEVDREQSISKAATNLFISKSALSESISSLEHELNVPIFTRKKKEISTTEAGKKIIKQAKVILAEVDRLYTLGDESPSLVDYEDVIRFGLNTKFSRTGLNHCLSILMNKYPKLTLSSEFLNYTEAIEKIKSGEIDFAITAYSDGLRPEVLHLLEENNIASIGMHNDSIICLANKHSQIAQKGSISTKELINHTLISYSNVVPESTYSSDLRLILLSDLTNVIQLIDDDIGITLLPYSMYKSSPWIGEHENIAVLSVTDTIQYNCILHSASTPLTVTQKYFIDLYKRIFEKNFAS